MGSLKSPLKGLSLLPTKHVIEKPHKDQGRHEMKDTKDHQAVHKVEGNHATKDKDYAVRFEEVAAQVYTMMKARMDELGPIAALPPGPFVKQRVLAAAKDVLTFAISTLVEGFNHLI